MTRGFIVWIGASGRAFTMNIIDGVVMAPKGFEAAGVHCGILLRAIRAKEVWLHLRYPKAAPIKGVMVNGKAWQDFDPAKEVVKLHDLKNTVSVAVQY